MTVLAAGPRGRTARRAGRVFGASGAHRSGSARTCERRRQPSEAGRQQLGADGHQRHRRGRSALARALGVDPARLPRRGRRRRARHALSAAEIRADPGRRLPRELHGVRGPQGRPAHRGRRDRPACGWIWRRRPRERLRRRRASRATAKRTSPPRTSPASTAETLHEGPPAVRSPRGHAGRWRSAPVRPYGRPAPRCGRRSRTSCSAPRCGPRGSARGSPRTMSASTSGSSSSMLMVGGAMRWCSARTVATVSMPPAPPSRWPVIDFVAETAMWSTSSPKTLRSALISADVALRGGGGVRVDVHDLGGLRGRCGPAGSAAPRRCRCRSARAA